MKVEVWNAAGEIDVCPVECLDGSKVFPVTVEQVAVDIVLLDRLGDDLIPEVDHRRIGQKVDEDPTFEQVDAH